MRPVGASGVSLSLSLSVDRSALDFAIDFAMVRSDAAHSKGEAL